VVESVIAGRYRLERQIGAGGMSEVWSAMDADLERSVAVKLLATDADPARFEREAHAAAGLAHPNVCVLYDYGEADGRRYMVLELLPGGSLEDRLAGGRRLPDDDTLRIATEIAAGLAHAHERGVVHRDLKPANILFDSEGRAKIADFGIARTAAATGLTQAGTVLGTAAYISPEQARGEPAAPASDVYAFGVILFRMLSGRLPFESSDALALAAMHRDLPAPSLTELRPDAPPLLESVAGAALAKSPFDRPTDGAALLDELRHAGQATTAVTQVIARPGMQPGKGRRSRLLLAFAIAAVAAAGVGLAMAVTLSNDAAPVTTSLPQTTTTAAGPAVLPSTSETIATSTAATTTSAQATTTTEATSTAAVTTPPPATTAPVTTAPATTTAGTTPAPTTTPATTVTPPPTTAVATTAPTTTAATTAAPAPTTGPATTSPVTTATPPTAPG
jgi:eukaryotic-like serine/threonine-protein kinase